MLTRVTNWYNILRAVLLVVGALVYCISPIDVVPDVVPIFGWLDDLVIVVTGVVSLISVLRRSDPPPPPPQS